MDGAGRAGTLKLELGLLGPIEVQREGEAVALGGQKPRALLAMLALEPGRVVSVDALVEALWPGDPPETAGHAVQVYVSQLRKALGPDRLLTRAPGYLLDLDPERVDVHRFGRLAREGRAALEDGDAASAEVALREALALWRGPALADFLYEPFAQTQIARLEELRTVIVEERIEADLALGRHLELVPELEALVQAERLRERPRAQLMLALYRSGRQADALAAYRDARETLVEELGIDPGPELRELEAAILRQDDALLLEETPLAKPSMQFRRLATILFCDVVDSMAIAEVLDAEALGTVQRRYFETVSAVIERHGGTVEKYAGDAVMAAFGVPISHEDDALRAARAALEIQTAVAALSEELGREHGLRLQVRIGLAAGEVVAAATEARQRFVAGDVVGVAARLEHSAEPGEVVVGEIVARLIDHAARLQPLGTLHVPSRKEPLQMLRLVELEQAPPAFEVRQDAPLVGRKRELAALRRSLKRATDGSSARIALVVAGPGVGKSRLAAELARRTRGITALWGRCLSYGEGITYWPLREMLVAAPESDARAEALAALEGETPPPAPEIALLFRRFCEALARERPLLVVFDDVHWAEPTLLELVAHLGEKGEGPILAICLGREELLEERVELLDGDEKADRITLDELSTAEAEALLDGLGGAELESDQRVRIAEAAEGNPLFLEQLLALALEGGLAGDRPLPATVQALLAARLDRLGPGERAVLERAAVIGKQFGLDDVTALLEPEAVPTAETHLGTLVARGFVRSADDEGMRFRHVLVQEAVYRSAPKRLRAELHERYADRLDEVWAELPELDEFVGYHLEQAYRLRTELGESDRRTERLAEDGGGRLGEAGIRALKRGDMHATVSLLQRATGLVPHGEPIRRELLSELGIGHRATGHPDDAELVLTTAVAESRAAGDRRAELRAQIEYEYVRLARIPGGTDDALIGAIADGIPVFEQVNDDRSLARAWLLRGFVAGARRLQQREQEDACERALMYYERLNWPTATCVGELASALYFGPTPVGAAIDRCEALLQLKSSDHVSAANVGVFLGGLAAQLGHFERARGLVTSAQVTFQELGHRMSAVPYCGMIMGDIEMLDDDVVSAANVLRDLCEALEELREFNQLASRAGDLAEALYAQDLLDEAEEWTQVAERYTPVDDIDAQVLWMPVRAKILARRGDTPEAESLATAAVGLLDSSDALNRKAKALRDLGIVLTLADRRTEARAALECAIELFGQKGNLIGARKTRSLVVEVAVA